MLVGHLFNLHVHDHVVQLVSHLVNLHLNQHVCHLVDHLVTHHVYQYQVRTQHTHKYQIHSRSRLPNPHQTVDPASPSTPTPATSLNF